MPKRILIVMWLGLTLALATVSVQSFVLDKVAIATRLDASFATQADQAVEKRGNRFVSVLAAPFKAIGRLFGRGRKDDNKLHRLSEKDVKQFESARVTRIVDANSAVAAPLTGQPATAAAESALPTGEEKLLQFDPNKALAAVHLARGRTLLYRNNVNEAIGALSLAASLDPKLRSAYNLLGIAYNRKGLRNLAKQSFEESLEREDDEAEHLNDFGFFLYENGDYERATKYLKRAVRAAPNEQRFWNNLALAQAERGKFDDAYKSFVQAVGEFDGRLNLATRLQRKGFDKEAIKQLEKARALQPGSSDVLDRLVTLYEGNGKYEEALEARRSLALLRSTANAATR